jgi:hypothetical protein
VKNKNNFSTNIETLADVIMHNLFQEEDYMARNTMYFKQCSNFINNISSEDLKNSLENESINSWRKLLDKLDKDNNLRTKVGEGAKKIMTEVMAGTRKDGCITLPIADTIVNHSNDKNPMKNSLQKYPQQSSLGKLKKLLFDADPEKLAKGFDEQLQKTKAVYKIDKDAGKAFLRADERSKIDNSASEEFDWLKIDLFSSKRKEQALEEKLDEGYSHKIKRQRTQEQPYQTR